MKKVLILFTALSLFASCNNTANVPGYSGNDVSNQAEITRDKQTKAAFIEIFPDTTWTIYAGNTPETIDNKAPLLQGDGYGKFALDIPYNERYYFRFVTKEGSALMAERHLPMEGGYNFRDLGGYPTTEGRFVKWGKIFRSDEMNRLTRSDLNYLSTIPIRSVVDFRTENEVQNAPDKVPASVVQSYSYYINPGNLDITNQEQLHAFDADRIDSVMMEINISLVSDPANVMQYKELFRLLQHEENTPLLFHCTAGKDRTGMGAALILFALGVDRDIIMDDYLLSNIYLKDKYGSIAAQHPNLSGLYGVNPNYLQAGINKIEEVYGSVILFLEQELEVDIQAFRDTYLY